MSLLQAHPLVQAGFCPPLSAEEYHSQKDLPVPALTYSIAKLLINQSPRHAYRAHPKLGNASFDPTDEMDTGTIMHALILGKGASLAVADYKDWKTREAQNFRDQARSGGRIPILQCKLAAIQEIVSGFEQQVRASTAAGFFNADSYSELACRWYAGDVLCQSMFDRVNLSRGHMYDIKCTTNAHPKKVAAKILDMGYDIQSEFYRRAFETLVPELAGRTTFTFLFLEVAPPHSVTPVRLSGTWRSLGESKVNRALSLWQDCLRSNTFPTYSAGDVLELEPPPWAFTEEFGIDY